jgi:hypothetical protein
MCLSHILQNTNPAVPRREAFNLIPRGELTDSPAVIKTTWQKKSSSWESFLNSCGTSKNDILTVLNIVLGIKKLTSLSKIWAKS